MYKVTNTINDEVDTFETIQEAKIHVMQELEFWNVYERQNPYTCDDFIIEKI